MPHPMIRPSVTALLLASLVLSGCSGRLAVAPQESSDQETPVDTGFSAPVEYASFQPATLYALLVAEIAAYRGLPQVTLHNYLQEAERTGDVGIIRRAAQLASQMRAGNALLKATLLWTQAEPDNPAPFRIATKELIRRGEVDQALPMLSRALELDSLEVIDTLANRAQKMSPEERQAYLNLLDQMLEKHPDEAHLLYAKASLIVYQDDLEEALELSQRALNAAPDYDRAILLEADLQSRTGHLDTAIGHLREQLGERDHKQIRTLYTRLLLEKKQYPLADQEAELLASNHPGDYNLLFYLGVLMLEHDRIDTSERFFNRLSELTGINSALSYYHGRIAQMRGYRDQALAHYLNVNDAPYLLASFTEVSRLLSRQEDRSRLGAIFAQARQQHDEASALLYALEASWLSEHGFDQDAMVLLNQALSAHPDDTRLRYSRAMLGEKLGDMGLLERDLRYLLEREPDNATALNALGYSLTDNTDRHLEALQLIKKALSIKPDDPAILDSMGWAYYHLGELQLAIDFLLRAYNTFPDPEIAAHLGTVYWALGETERALQVWNEALQRNPDNQLIIDAKRVAQQHGI